MIGLQFRGTYDFNVELELEQMAAATNALWLIEHAEDGTHTDVHALSLEVTGNVEIGGTLDVGGDTQIGGSSVVPDGVAGGGMLTVWGRRFFDVPNDILGSLEGMDVYGRGNFFDDPDNPYSSAIRTNIPFEMARAPFWEGCEIVGTGADNGDPDLGGVNTIAVTGDTELSYADMVFYTHLVINTSGSTPRLTGFEGQDSGSFSITTDEQGRIFYISNRTSNNVTIVHAGGIDAFDFYCPYQNDFILAPGMTVAVLVTGGLTGDSVGFVLGSSEGVWQTYTPAWTTTGTQPALGNGTLTGRWCRIGKTINFFIQLSPGSTTTYGTGNFRFSTPTSINTLSNVIGNTRMNDTSSGNTHFGTWFIASATTLAMFTNANPIVAVTGTAPFAWANGDFLFVCGFYEEA